MRCARLRFATLGAIAVIAMTFATTANATTYYWYGSDSTLGGDGIWNTTDGYWSTGSTSKSGKVWSDTVALKADYAIFNGAVGTVTVNGNIAANGLGIYTNGYVVQGGTLSLGGGGIDVVGTNISGTVSSDVWWTGGYNTYTIGTGCLLYCDGKFVGSGTNFRKQGSGTMTIMNTSTGSNNLIHEDGTLVLGNASALGTALLTFGYTAGSIPTLSVTKTMTLANSMQFKDSCVAVFSAPADVELTVSGVLKNNGTTIAGTIAVANASTGTLTLTGNNTFAGTINLQSGVLQAGNANSLGTTSKLIFGGGTLAYGGITTDFSGKFSTATGQAFNINTNGQNVTFATALAGASNTLTKLGAGVLTLSKTNTYTGATTVNAGTLKVTGSIASSAATVAGGSLALVGGTAGAVSVSSGAALTGYGTAGTVSMSSGGILGSSTDNNAWGGTLATGKLSVGGNNNLNFGNVGNYTTTAGVNVTQTDGLTWSGAGTVNVYGSMPTASGTAHLMQYAGAVTGALNYTLGVVSFANSHSTYTLATSSDSGNNYLNLNYTIDYPYWTGAGDGDWTTATQIAKNWKLVSDDSDTDYVNNDIVLFDNRGSTTTTVTLAENVTPNSVVFSNTSAVSYVLASTSSGAYGIGGAATVAINGGGAVTLLTDNTYTGATTISNASTLQVGNGGAAGSLVGDVVNNGALIFNRSGSVAYGGVVSGTGSVSKIGSGTLTLSSANSYTGGTTLSGGWLVYNQNLAFGTTTNVLTLAGGTLTTTVDGLRIYNNTIAADNTNTYVGVFDSTANVSFRLYPGALTGKGTITCSIASATNGTFWIVSTGDYTKFEGTMVLQKAPGFFYSTGVINAGSSSWVINARYRSQYSSTTVVGSASLGALSGTDSTAQIDDQSAGTVNYVIGALGINTTYAGHIYDNGSGTSSTVKIAMTKVGAGVLTLTGTSAYTGGTTLYGGGLVIDGALTSPVAVIGGVLGGSGSIAGDVTVTGGAVAPGNSPATLTIAGVLSLGSGASLSFELNGADTTVGGGVNDLIQSVTNLTLDGTLNVTETVANSFLSANVGDQWTLITYTGGLTNNGLDLGTMPTLSGTRFLAVDTTTTGQVNLVVIPEPGTLTLLAAGLLGLIAYAWRKRK
jgi:autotransporter-associated beta strand protein